MSGIYKQTMIALFSDFSFSDPYVGLMKIEIYKRVPNTTIIDICHDLPAFNPNASGRLLQALVKNLPENTIVLAVVDPGVGTDRHALWLEVDGKHFIGPDNGLFARIVNEAQQVSAHIIEYDKTKVSASFHGRDVFAPFAADLELGLQPVSKPIESDSLVGHDWSTQLAKVIYIDHYGNVMTGISASAVKKSSEIRIKNMRLQYARTFADANNDTMFWYKNSLGLIELAMFGQSLQTELSVQLGDNVILYE